MVQRTEKELKQQIEEGNIKEASARITIPKGGTENFVIKTPVDENVKLSILSYTITNTATVNLDFYDNVTIDTPGTDMLINNSKTTGNVTDSTPLTFEYGGTYSGGSLKGENLIPAGAKAKATGARTTDIRRIVSNGSTVRYEFTNTDDSNSQDVAVKIVFFEKPVE